ncbi:MAG TPA: 50S ribosomal protein L6 [Candidatus Paceibacterota bacterium]
MSRIGKKIINIPQGVIVTKDGDVLKVKGPKGELSKTFKPVVDVILEGETISFKPANSSILAKALWGTYASHVNNMIEGVTKGFEKKLIIEGVGFKANMQANKLVLDIGFSHVVEEVIPEGLTVTTEKNVITVSGFDKELVGQFSSTVRLHKRTEPYKGKGIRYDGEKVLRKQGKKTVS